MIGRDEFRSGCVIDRAEVRARRCSVRLAACFALLSALSGCAHLWSDPLPKTATPHRAKTDDGWELALVRYKPPNGVVTGRPVLLCHGISANGRNLDLDDAHSLARWLAAHGREAWTLSLRGTGDSDGADEKKGRAGGWTFDTFWQHDLPAAIGYVKQQTGAESLDYVGHSMGGMLAYAYLSQGGEGLNAAATLGSPTRLDWNGTMDGFMGGLLNTAIGRKGTVPVLALAHATIGLQGELLNTPVDLLLYNPKNVSAPTFKRLVAVGLADIPGALGMQLMDFVRDGSFGSADGKRNYRQDMGKIQRPVLVVAGKGDRLATTPAVKDGFRALGGPKEWFLVGEVNGAVADYGHMDLVIGDRASTEVWPKVLDFFERHR
ncbi:MAG: alpha/beta fold hydrolase [Myxococcaceae bacterium]